MKKAELPDLYLKNYKKFIFFFIKKKFVFNFSNKRFNEKGRVARIKVKKLLQKIFFLLKKKNSNFNFFSLKCLMKKAELPDLYLKNNKIFFIFFS